MATDLRCANKKHAVIVDEDLIEIKCDSRFCGAGNGAVILHRFNHQGELVETLKYKNPGRRKSDAVDNDLAAIRTA